MLSAVGVLQVSAQTRLLEERQANTQLLEARMEERTRDLRAAQDLLVRQERLVTQGRLAATIGHEVGNPLNFVIGGAGELDHGAFDEAQHALKLVSSGSERIKRWSRICEAIDGFYDGQGRRGGGPPCR